MIEKIHKDIQTNLKEYNQELVDMKPQGMYLVIFLKKNLIYLNREHH